MNICLVITVLNEAYHIHRLFDSVLLQTRLPDEIIVCDAGSKDNTVTILSKYSNKLPLRILVYDGANISTGRNVAIEAAQSEIIAVTDAGVTLSPSWLENLTSSFTDEKIMHVAGFFNTDSDTTFEKAMGATVLPLIDDIRSKQFLPSSRSVAFRKSVWKQVGGYPNWLDYSEDVVFDQEIIKQYGSFHFIPTALVQFKPRGTLKQFFRQYYNYASGDGHAGLFVLIHLIRYFTYLIAIPISIYAATTINPSIWLLGVIAGLTYIRRPIVRAQRLWYKSPLLEKLIIISLIPIIRVTGDIAKIVGYPVGIWKRIKFGKNT